jgi:hypothetical protein
LISLFRGRKPWSAICRFINRFPSFVPAIVDAAKDPNDPVERIKDEGMNHSQVMQTLSYLSDVIGPRLTASPGMKRSNEWTRDQLTKWGLQNAHLEAWGPFGRGWSLKRFSAQVSEPLEHSTHCLSQSLVARHWRDAHRGGGLRRCQDEADLQRFKGKLKGAIVLTGKMREVKANFEPMGTRRDEKDLLTLADAPEPRLAPAGAPTRSKGLRIFSMPGRRSFSKMKARRF